MKTPLHIPQHARHFDYVANLRAAAPAWLRVRAQYAFLMTQLGAAVAAKSKTSKAQINGFRSPSTKKHHGAWRDLAYADRCLVDAGMTQPPKPPEPDPKKVEADKAYKAAVRANREPSLTNYEQGCYMRVKRQHPEAVREDFVGIRSV